MTPNASSVGHDGGIAADVGGAGGEVGAGEVRCVMDPS
jgi:hypothetical protein